jgi:trans-2,3-dihydro-3-hydroxyanthranilate isomerase
VLGQVAEGADSAHGSVAAVNERMLFPEAGERGAPGTGSTLDYTVLDVFTTVPLEGNQLAVFTDGRSLTGDEMQRLARELNLSETVFLLPAEADGDARLRIFTPQQELPFAGHPVLGTAHVVAEALGTGSVRLETVQGTVAIELTRDGARIVHGRMRQPIPSVEPYTRSAELLAALGVAGSELPVEVYNNGPVHVMVMLASPGAVAAVRPDLAALGGHGALGVSCFARDGDDWKTRMFAPGLGVNEDPATGSAAGPLVVHLARHGIVGFGEEITIHQGAEIGRPSVLKAKAVGSTERIEAVEVGGQAVVVARGTFLVRSARDS